MAENDSAMPWAAPSGPHDNTPAAGGGAPSGYFAPRTPAFPEGSHAAPSPDARRPTVADAMRAGGFQRGGAPAPAVRAYRPPVRPIERPRTRNIPGLVAAAIAVGVLATAYGGLPWLKFDSSQLTSSANFHQLYSAFTATDSQAPGDLEFYFGYLGYTLTVVLIVFAAAANLGVQTRIFKWGTLLFGALGLCLTFEVWLHMLIKENVSTVLGGSISLGVGAWVAMLAFAIFIVSGLMAP